MIVGQSHYYSAEDEYSLIKGNNEFTREVVNRLFGNESWDMFANLMKMLFAIDEISELRKKAFFENIAFYNFIQEPMANIKQIQTPNKNLIDQAWTVFPKVLEVFNLDYCLFVGNSIFAINKSYPLINRSYPRILSWRLNDKDVHIIAVKHTSRYFSWKKWYDFLSNKNNNWTEPLERCRSKPQ